MRNYYQVASKPDPVHIIEKKVNISEYKSVASYSGDVKVLRYGIFWKIECFFA